MSLQDRISLLAAQPASVKLRMQLAHDLAELGREKEATEVAACAVRVSASLGEFFSSLALCRLHLPRAAQEVLLFEMARRFAADQRKDGVRLPRPQPSLKSIQIPKDPEALIALAHRVGTDTQGIGYPLEAPMPYVPLFGDLNTPEFVQVALSVEPVTLQSGEVLIEQGSREQALYLLSHGTIEIKQLRANKDLVTLASVKAPSYIGEMSILTTLAHRFSAIALEKVIAWKLTGEQLSIIASKHPEIIEHLRELIKRRQVTNIFRLSDVLSAVEVKERLLRAFRLRVIEVDEEVFGQGVEPPGLFLLLHGEAVVLHHTPDGRRVHLATLSEGDTFGEFSLLNNEPTSAAVWMPDGGLVLHLPVESYRMLRRLEPNLEQSLRHLMELRRQAFRNLAEPIHNSQEELDAAWIFPVDQKAD